jgi:hypothetical protein
MIINAVELGIKRKDEEEGVYPAGDRAQKGIREKI